MKISELVRILNDAKRTYGDLPVVCWDTEIGRLSEVMDLASRLNKNEVFLAEDGVKKSGPCLEIEF